MEGGQKRLISAIREKSAISATANLTADFIGSFCNKLHRKSQMVMRLAYSIKEAVEASRLSQRKLYLMMDRGELRFTKVGRRRLIPASALREAVGETEGAA